MCQGILYTRTCVPLILFTLFESECVSVTRYSTSDLLSNLCQLPITLHYLCLILRTAKTDNISNSVNVSSFTYHCPGNTSTVTCIATKTSQKSVHFVNRIFANLFHKISCMQHNKIFAPFCRFCKWGHMQCLCDSAKPSIFSMYTAAHHKQDHEEERSPAYPRHVCCASNFFRVSLRNDVKKCSHARRVQQNRM